MSNVRRLGWLRLPWKTSLGTHRIALLLTTGVVSLAVCAALVVVLSSRNLGPDSERWGVASVALVVVAWILVCSVQLVELRTLLRRVKGISAALEKEISSDQLIISLTEDQNDEIGNLVSKLNILGQKFEATIAEESRRVDDLAVLDLLATTINRTLDLQEVLDTSLKEVLRVVKWEVGAIYMWDDRSDALNMVSYRGLTENAVRENISYGLGEGFIGRSAQLREPAIVYPDQHGLTPPKAVSPGWPNTQISIPLVAVPGQLLGTLNMGGHDKKELSPDDLTLLMTVAEQIALAIDKAQLYTKVSEHAAELENLVAARTEQLSQAIDELWIALKQAREADRVKSLLLSTVSHELRTPLATIKGSTSLLIEHNDRIPSSQRLEHLRDIDEEADKLTDLISSLLEMSRIEAGTLHIQLQPVDVVEVVREIVAKSKVRFRGREIMLETSRVSLTCMGDARRIEQVVANLLDNAAKYSPSGAAINVGVRKKGASVVVSISDLGIGIAEEHLRRIFDRFYQVSMNSDSGRHGIGLGLAICKGLVEAQGGQIWATSKVGQGSKFFFSLPLAREVSGAGGD